MSSLIEMLLLWTTISFLEYLQSQGPRRKLLIICDDASYHCLQEIKDYLDLLNTEKEKEQLLIACERFAPNAPQQNPVEDIWLQAKRLIREFYFSAILSLSSNAYLNVDSLSNFWIQ